MPNTDKFLAKKSKYRSLHSGQIFALLCLLCVFTYAAFVNASTVSANAHVYLTDGINATNSPTDPAWVVFDRDSNQLPIPFTNSPNLEPEFFGTNEFKNNNIDTEKYVEGMLYDAGVKGYRITLYTQVFPEPNQTAPYWDWSWFDNYPDGQRILRAINKGQMVNLLVQKTPGWANKSLPLEHPPEAMALQEEIALNGTAPAQLAHPFIMGEKNEEYDKVSVVSSGTDTPYQYIDSEDVGTGDASTYQEFNLAHLPVISGQLKLFVNGILWNEVPYFQNNSGNSTSYVFFPNTGKIRFGDGWTGSILPIGAKVTAQYSYYTNPFKEYNGNTYNTTDQLDFRINYTNGTIQRTANSTIPSGAKVRVTYYYLDTSWWKNFWKELTAHYAGKVKYFEVWNEEDLTTFWQGTPEQYAEMLRSAYASAKAGNPNAQILLGGLAVDSPYLSTLYSLNTKNSFDTLAWHPYGYNLGPDNPASVFNTTNNTYSDTVNANGDNSKSVFLNEIGYCGLTWDDQAIALSRTYMITSRNPVIANVSWWGITDVAPIGVNEDELWISHLGLMAYDTSGVLHTKPSYFTFKNLATNKGIIFDLATYSLNGALIKEDFNINKITFTSLGDDILSTLVFTSWKNNTDWQQVPSTSMTVQKNTRGTYDYTINFPATLTRFVQIQLAKKSNVTKFALDEMSIFSINGINVALNKYYAVAGFAKEATISLPVNNIPDPNPSAPINGGESNSGQNNNSPPPSSGNASAPDLGGSSSGGSGSFSGGSNLGYGEVSDTPVIACKTNSDCDSNDSCQIASCINPDTNLAQCVLKEIDGCGIASDSNYLNSNNASSDSTQPLPIDINTQPISILVPDTIPIGQSFAVMVTDANGLPAIGASIIYANQQKVTDYNGTVFFEAKKDESKVIAIKNGVSAQAFFALQSPPEENNSLFIIVIGLLGTIIISLFIGVKAISPLNQLSVN